MASRLPLIATLAGIFGVLLAPALDAAPQKTARTGPPAGTVVRPAPISKHVLLIGVDGSREDARSLAQTPEMDELRVTGAFTHTAVAALPTLSGPNWASMLTGTLPGKHGVLDNTFAGSNFESYPHVFQRIKEVTPWRHTASIVHWAAINDEITTGADLELGGLTDDQVIQEAVDLIEGGDPQVLFVHLNDVDAAGHAFGFDPSVPEYLAAIEATDARIGILRDALRQRQQTQTGRFEDWVVMVTSDHGGLGTTHGGSSVQERNLFWIVSGPSILNGVQMPDDLSITTIPLTLLDFLGIEPLPAWNLDGSSILPSVIR